jgi:hypothetical protein
MNEEKFTDDNEFSELKKLLKEIPKVKAPDNFEFNLMTKIQNQNFEVKSEKKKSIFSWALTPAIAFAVSVFLVLFLFTNEDDLLDNPWNSTPRLIENNIAEVNSDQPKTSAKKKSSSPKANKSISNKVSSNNLVAETNNQKDFPFEKGTSVNLDEGLQIDSNPNSNTGSARLAGSSNSNTSRFNGFFLREVEKYQKEDSLDSRKDSTSQSENLE